MLATNLLAEYPSPTPSPVRPPRRIAKLRYDGGYFVDPKLARQLVGSARRSVGLHRPYYTLQARHICKDLDRWRHQLADVKPTAGLLDVNEAASCWSSSRVSARNWLLASLPPLATDRAN